MTEDRARSGEMRRRKVAEGTSDADTDARDVLPKALWTPTSASSVSLPGTSTVKPNTQNGTTKSTLTGAQVQKDESRTRKILSRVLGGAAMFGVFAGSVYMGHLYICALVALIEMLLFRELVRVRYSTYFMTIQDTIPLFRDPAVAMVCCGHLLHLRRLCFRYYSKQPEIALPAVLCAAFFDSLLLALQWHLCIDHCYASARLHQVSKLISCVGQSWSYS